MIDQINGNMMAGGMSMMFEPKTITDEQKEKIQEILSNYDADSITAEDAKEIFEAFKEAGITPCKGMKEAIEEAGFDADELRSLAGFDQPPPPPQGLGSQSININQSALQALQTILNDYDLTELSEDEQAELLTRLQEAGFMKYPGATIDLSA